MVDSLDDQFNDLSLGNQGGNSIGENTLAAHTRRRGPEKIQWRRI